MSTLPLKAMSRLWGRFNEIELPYYLRVPGFKLYSPRTRRWPFSLFPFIAGCIASQPIPFRTLCFVERDNNSENNRGGFGSRLGFALRNTKVEWYPIPVGLGSVL
jgi:hypothetical protein